MGPKNLATPAIFISSLRLTPRRNRCSRTNKGLNCQETLLRTILSSANQDHGRKSGTPPKATSQSVLRESTSAMSQLWKYGGGAIQGETVTSALNAHN